MEILRIILTVIFAIDCIALTRFWKKKLLKSKMPCGTMNIS